MVDKRVPTCYYIRIENTLFDIAGKEKQSKGCFFMDALIKTPTVFLIGWSWSGIKSTNTDILRSVHLCRNNLLGVVLWKIPVFLGSAQSLEPSVLQARHKLSCN